MVNSEQKPELLFDQDESRVCNMCLTLKLPSKFSGNDIGCRECRNKRRRETKYARDNNLEIVPEYGRYVNGSQVRVLTMLATGKIKACGHPKLNVTNNGLFHLHLDTIMGASPVSRQVAQSWMKSEKFRMAVDSVARLHCRIVTDSPGENPTRDEVRRGVDKGMAQIATEAKMPGELGGEDDSVENSMRYTKMTPEERFNSIVGLVALVDCELYFGVGDPDSTLPVRCILSEQGDMMAKTHGQTATEAMDIMVSRITNEDLGVVSINAIKEVLGEQGFINKFIG